MSEVKVTREMAQLCLDGIDAEELYSLGMADELSEGERGLVLYCQQLIGMIMLYRAQLRDPCEVVAIRETARRNCKAVLEQ